MSETDYMRIADRSGVRSLELSSTGREPVMRNPRVSSSVSPIPGLSSYIAALLVHRRWRCLLQQLGIAGHIAKRGAQVMQYVICQRLQLLINGLKFYISLSQFLVQLADFIFSTLPLGRSRRRVCLGA
jgi:hypothetical protein